MVGIDRLIISPARIVLCCIVQYARNALLFNVSFVLPLHADTVRGCVRSPSNNTKVSAYLSFTP